MEELDIDIDEFINSGELTKEKLLAIVQMAYDAGRQIGFNEGALETLRQLETLNDVDIDDEDDENF